MKPIRRQTLIRLCILFSVILVLSVGWIIFDNTVDRSGWGEKNGVIYYRDFHGKKIVGWLELETGIYYFDENYTLVTGWQDFESGRRYFGSDGAMYTGWKNVEDIRCYFGSNGVLHTGWLDLNDNRYYLEETGAMVSGWKALDSSTYYFGENGAMLTGWNVLEGKTYYFEENGSLVTGRIMLEGKQYYFQDDGVMFTNWEETENGRRYYGEDGIQRFGWVEIDEKWFFFGEEGLTRTGWFQDGEYNYYLLDDGSAAVGPTEIDGHTYYFTPKGIQVVLVNADHPVPEYYKLTKVTYIPWHEVAEIALEPLKQMLEDCVDAGYEYEFNSAYRSIKVQEDILWARTQEYINIGYTDPQAYAKARETVALPGTSEHHLGLAVDVLNKKDAELEALDWLGEHCWEYGFIVRYAADKSHITGIVHEPWHFRYVGPRVSMDMKDSGLCLEEYLGAGAVSDSTISAANEKEND